MRLPMKFFVDLIPFADQGLARVCDFFASSS